ncbi:MAG: hypothetical protein AAB778_02950 [Patescibacteria group bacterium]
MFVFSSQTAPEELWPKGDSVTSETGEIVDWVAPIVYNLRDGSRFPIDEETGKSLLIKIYRNGFRGPVWDESSKASIWINDANGTEFQTIALSGVIAFPTDAAALAGNKVVFNISGIYAVSNTYMPINWTSVRNQNFEPEMSPSNLLKHPDLAQQITCQFISINKDRSVTSLNCDDVAYWGQRNYYALGPENIKDNGYLVESCSNGGRVFRIQDVVADVNRLRNESTNPGLWAEIDKQIEALKLLIQLPQLAPTP